MLKTTGQAKRAGLFAGPRFQPPGRPLQVNVTAVCGISGPKSLHPVATINECLDRSFQQPGRQQDVIGIEGREGEDADPSRSQHRRQTGKNPCFGQFDRPDHLEACPARVLLTAGQLDGGITDNRQLVIGSSDPVNRTAENGFGDGPVGREPVDRKFSIEHFQNRLCHLESPVCCVRSSGPGIAGAMPPRADAGISGHP